MLAVWAVDPNRVRRGIISSKVIIGSPTVVLKDADAGAFQIEAKASDPLVAQIGRGWRLLFVDDGGTVASGFIRGFGGNTTLQTRTITGVDDLFILQARALDADPSKPFTGQTAEGKYKVSGPAETVIRDIVNTQIGPGAVTARRHPGFVVPASQGRGATVKVNDADKPILDILRPLARTGGITFSAVQEETDNRIMLRFYVPVDRSRSVRFTEQNGGLGEGTWEFLAPEVNVMKAAGQGAGTYLNRREYVRSTDWGIRVEEFMDQTSTDDDAEIKQAADEALDEGRESATATFAAHEVPGLRFGTDYFMGDTVSVEFGPETVSEPVRMVELTWDGFGRTASLTLGDHDSADDKTPKWVKKIKKLDARVRGLETR